MEAAAERLVFGVTILRFHVTCLEKLLTLPQGPAQQQRLTLFRTVSMITSWSDFYRGVGHDSGRPL
jgi:hypothetical protein